MVFDKIEPEFASRNPYGLFRAFAAHGLYGACAVAVSDVVAHQFNKPWLSVYGLFGVNGHENTTAFQSVVHQLRTRFKSFYGERADIYFFHGI